MIEVKVQEDMLVLKCHACRNGADGIDRVCAAVSALTCSLVNSLTDLADESVHTDMQTGNVTIKWQKLSDKGRMLVDSWFLGLTDINREYHCIQFI